MAVMKKDPAAAALGRKGGKKGGPARAAKLTPEQRSASARKAVQARWTKAKKYSSHKLGQPVSETEPDASAVSPSDRALLALLKRIEATDSPAEIRRLSGQLERAIFDKQVARV